MTDIFPLYSDHTVPDKLNIERATSILIEAAEQCERLTIPKLHAPQKLAEIVFSEPCFWAAERENMRTKTVRVEKITAILIGPEGGFSGAEVIRLQSEKFVFPLSLGMTVLRTDTAVVAGLAQLYPNRFGGKRLAMRRFDSSAVGGYRCNQDRWSLSGWLR